MHCWIFAFFKEFDEPKLFLSSNRASVAPVQIVIPGTGAIMLSKANVYSIALNEGILSRLPIEVSEILVT